MPTSRSASRSLATQYVTVTLTALLLVAPLVGCTSSADNAAASKKLELANQRIAALETELASLKSNVPSAVVSAPVPGATAALEQTSAPKGAEPAPAASPMGQQWFYNVSEEQMTSGKRKTASVESTNTVEFGFPYDGAQHGQLTLRTDPRYGKDVIFRIEKGQILCPSYEGCAVQVRFDDEKPTSFAASAAADHSSDVVFLENYNGFLAKLKKARRVRLSMDIYQNGRPVFDFDVSGFDNEKYQAKS